VREANKDTGDYTQWIVIKDLTQKIFCFRSYGDLGLKVIDLKKINFNRDMKKTIPLSLKKGYFDVTDLLKMNASITVQKDEKSLPAEQREGSLN
jgi:penicillin V acylase-like amidase (Ntn superfamily)